jgi:hypothetical protein
MLKQLVLLSKLVTKLTSRNYNRLQAPDVFCSNVRSHIAVPVVMWLQSLVGPCTLPCSRVFKHANKIEPCIQNNGVACVGWTLSIEGRTGVDRWLCWQVKILDPENCSRFLRNVDNSALDRPCYSEGRLPHHRCQHLSLAACVRFGWVLEACEGNWKRERQHLYVAHSTPLCILVPRVDNGWSM